MRKEKLLKIRIREKMRNQFKRLAAKRETTMSEMIIDFIKREIR